MRASLVYLFLFIIHGFSHFDTLSIDLTFSIETPNNSLLFNVTSYFVDKQNISDLKLHTDTSQDLKIVFSLINDSIYLSNEPLYTHKEYLILVTFRQTDFSLDYILFNVKFESVNKPVFNRHSIQGIISINSPPYSIVSDLTELYFSCSNGTKCFDSVTLECETNICPFEMELLPVNTLYYIAVYTTGELTNISTWYLNVTLHNRNQDEIKLELIIDSVYDIFHPTFKKTVLQYEFSESTRIGTFLFKPELTNPWSNDSYLFSLQSNLAAFYLNLDSENGEITLRSEFDCEFHSTILVTVEVRFVANISVTIIQSISTANFLINLIDVSEFAPIFSHPVYESEICTDISTNQFIAFTPVQDNDVMSMYIPELLIELTSNQSVSFELEHGSVWIGKYTGSKEKNEISQTFRIFAVDSHNNSLISEALLLVRFTKCLNRAPNFFQNPVVLKVSPLCPSLYQLDVFYDYPTNRQKMTTFELQTFNENICRIDINGILNCSFFVGELTVFTKAENSSLAITFENEIENPNTFLYPSMEPTSELLILTSAVEREIFDFNTTSNWDQFNISGIFSSDFPIFIENSVLKVSQNAIPGEYIFEVICSNNPYSIPFHIFPFKLEIHSAFATEKITLNFPFLAANFSIYNIKPEFGAFTYQIQNTIGISLALNNHLDNIYTTREIRNNSRFLFQILATSTKDSNLTQTLVIDASFSSGFQNIYFHTPKRLIVNLPKFSNQEIYNFNYTATNLSLKILGENNLKLFTISGFRILLKKSLYFVPYNLTLSIQISSYNSSKLISNSFHNIRIIFRNSSIIPINTLPLHYKLILPICTAHNSHIFKLPTLPSGEFKLNSNQLQIVANGSLIYTGSTPAYSPINQSIYFLYESIQYIFATIRIDFIDQPFESEISFSINSDTQIGTKIGRIWNQTQEACTYFQIVADVPFHIDSATGDIFVSSYLEESWYQFNVELKYYCQSRVMRITIFITPVSYINIFANESYIFSFQRANSLILIGQIITRRFSTPPELFLVTNSSLYISYFWLQNSELFTNGFSEKVDSLLLIAKACIPSTQICSYAHIQLYITSSNISPPKFSHQSLNIYVPSSQPINTQIFHLTSYDLDSPFDPLNYSVSDPFINIAQYGTIYFIATPIEEEFVTNIKVTDMFGAHSNLFVSIYVYRQFNPSIYFAQIFYNFSIDPILNREFELTPINSGIFGYTLLFTEPLNALLVNNICYLSVEDTQTDDIQTILIVYSIEYLQIGTTILQINIINPNHAPHFPAQITPINIYTNASIGSNYEIPKAIDTDLDLNGIITYSIESYSQGIPRIFTLDPIHGSLTLIWNLTEFQFHNINITIRATDQGNPPLFDDVTLTINIKPEVIIEFRTETETYNITLPNSGMLFRIQTSTQFDDISLAIINIFPNEHFYIDSDGYIYATTHLDTQFQFQYTLVIEARLRLSIAIIRVFINVDFQFEFESNSYQTFLPENLAVNTIIFQPNLLSVRLETYFFFDTKYTEFRVNSSRYITLISQLDYERTHSYILLLNAFSPFLNKTVFTTLFINISDINDNIPTFLGTPPHLAYIFTFAIRKEIYQFYAIDLDNGENGNLSFRIEQSSVANIFTISNTGLVSFIEYPISYQTGYSISILAHDNGFPSFSTTVLLTISVHQIIPHKLPIFEHTIYEIDIKENFIDFNKPVTYIHAFSPFPIEYGIVTNSSDFRIHIQTVTQNIFIRSLPDFEVSSRHVFNISASDGNSTQYCSFIVNILDVNDNKPVFSKQIYKTIIEENNNIGDIVLSLNVTDSDSSYNGEVSLYFEDEILDSFFQIFGTDLVAKVAFDFEKNQSLEFEVFAIDNGDPRQSSSCIVTVEIENLNDNPPIVPIETNIVYLHENSTEQNIFSIPATDEDNLTLDFKLQNDFTYFAITNTGVLYLVLSPLRGTYQLNVNVTDGIHSILVPISILVGNVNENSPKIDQSTCMGNLFENAPNNTFVTQIAADDNDFGINGEISYLILTNFDVFNEANGGVSLIENVFKIDSKTGIITTNFDGSFLVGEIRTLIDAEFNSEINLDIIAIDGGGLQDFCRVTISILDLNDNSPSFDRDLYSITYTQIIQSTRILTVYSFDPDQGRNGMIRYSLINANGFIIESTSGVIISIGSIYSGNYTFSVSATDNGSPYLQSTAEIQIIVQNDLLPQPIFEQNSYSFTVFENQSLHTVFLQVNASTDDSTYIIYSIRASNRYKGNSEGTFLINGITGEISLTQHLDFERLIPCPCFFQILAQASNFESSSFVYVYIYVRDVNDNYPTFRSHIITFNLNEEKPNGTFVGRLVAQDSDSGLNGEIEYFLHDTSLHVPFVIRLDGSILSNQVMDHEDTISSNLYTFICVAIDKCGTDCSLSQVVSVVIRIRDINDNPPIFSVDIPDILSIIENTVPPKDLTVLIATDRDQLSVFEIKYSIILGNINAVFSIDIRTGHLSLVQILDFETQSEYNLTITVCDGKFCAQHNLRIIVIDIDDSLPVFSREIYQFQIPESIVPGSSVLTVSATDVDLPENTFLIYEISAFSTAANYFSINNRTGVLTTISQIDREVYSSLEFYCFAKDSNNNRGKAIINAEISDINESPFFSRPLYETFIPENLPINTLVGYFPAIDRDNGENSTLKYELNNNNEFRIDQNTGHLYTRKIFDFEEKTIYLLILKASDNGVPSLYTTTQIQILIEDLNDHTPFFICQQMYSRIYDNVINNSVVTKIKIFDYDEIPIFRIQLLTPNLPFIISPVTGEVILIHYLTEKSYILEVALSDPVFNFQEIGNFTITVLPTNKRPPIYTSSTNEFSVLIGSNKGVEIGTISAFDPDGGKLTHFLNDTNFRIDTETGIITLNIIPNIVKIHYVNVTLLDLGYPQLSTEILIIISIKNYFENRIIFAQEFYAIDIEEENDSFEFLQVQVLNIPVNYQIKDNFDTFSINTNNGKLSLIKLLDREFQSFYNITIIATSENGMFGSTYILITVSDLNDNPTRETNSNLFIRLPQQTLTVKIPFDDPDSNDHFQNCSYLSGSLEFRITSDCQILFSSLNSGIYSIDITGTDGVHSYVANHITINVESFQYLVPEKIFSFILQNSLNDVFQNISILQTKIDSIFQQKIVIFSIEENLENTLINFYTEDSIDISLVLYTIYSNRNIFAEIGLNLESIQSEPCDSEPCANQGVCNNSLYFGPINSVSFRQNILISPQVLHSYECICALGSAGKNCDINIDDCTNIYCQNGGNCVDLLQDFYCECPEGVFGKYCENTIDHCATNSCQNAGKCVEKLTHFECECRDGFYGETCQYSFTKMTDLCATIECQNNSTCTASKYNHTCTCSNGFSGKFCSIQTNGNNTPCDINPCYHGGICIEDIIQPQSYKCVCVEGYFGPDCCYPLDACELFPCKNGGNCLSGFFGDYICDCPIGLSGIHCEIFVTESENVGIENCPIGFVGNECQLPAFPPNYCLANECQNQAFCSYGFDNYTCSCRDGFSGNLCQFPTQPSGPCGSNPCRHNGNCVENGTEFECECIIGVTGQFCETNIDECGTETCGFGACLDGFGAFKCECQDGYIGEKCHIKCPIGTTGHNCNISEKYCHETSCTVNYECFEVSDGFECLCPIGFGGADCDTPLSCDNMECNNDGVCESDSVYGFRCICSAKYWGINCELLRSTSFNGRSFIRFQGSVLPNQNAEIDFSLYTASSNGLVLFATNFRNFGHKDFIIVDITNSIIRLTLSFGGDNHVIYDCTNTQISDKNLHNISLAFSTNAISICVDDCPKNCEIHFDSFHHSIDGVFAVFFGGIPYDPSLKISQNYTGCLQDLFINKQQIDLSDGYHFQTVEMCPRQISTPCDPIKCHTRSSCVETNEGPICICNYGYSGSNCEEIVQSITLESGDYIQVVAKNRISRDLNYLNLVLNSFSVSILPRSQTGTILNITDASHYLKLELTPTHLELTTDTNSVTVPIANIFVPWYQISFQIERNILTLHLNDETTELELNTLHILNGGFSSIFIGGAEVGIHGCIQDIRLNDYQLQGPNPAFQLVTHSSDQNSIPKSGCQAACTNSVCGFGQCVPLSSQESGYICQCIDSTYKSSCPANEPSNTTTYILLLIIAIFIILFFTILLLFAILIYCGHKHFEKERLYSVQVYGNDTCDNERKDGEINAYAFGQSKPRDGFQSKPQTGTGTGTKDPTEPSILSDEVAVSEIPQFDIDLCRGLILRREAYLCDDDTQKAYSDSEGEELLTNSLSRDSELSISNVVPIGTLHELGSPFKQLVNVIYTEFDDNDS